MTPRVIPDWFWKKKNHFDHVMRIFKKFNKEIPSDWCGQTSLSQ